MSKIPYRFTGYVKVGAAGAVAGFLLSFAIIKLREHFVTCKLNHNEDDSDSHNDDACEYVGSADSDDHNDDACECVDSDND